MASLASHHSVTIVGDSDKAAPEPDHSRQEESHTQVLEEEMPHMHSGDRAHKKQDGVLHAGGKEMYQHC